MRGRWSAVVVVMLPLMLTIGLAPVTDAARRTDDARWDAREVILVENRAGSEWNQAIAFSVNGWKKAFPRLKFRVVNKPGKRCAQETGKIIVCEVAPNDQWGGHTSWRTREHAILSAKIRMTHNVRDGAPMWDGYISMADMAVLCHEFGHALGLLHNAHPETSCMANPVQRMTPGPYDRNSLKLLYRQRGEGWP